MFLHDPKMVVEPELKVITYPQTKEQKEFSELVTQRVGVEIKGMKLPKMKHISQVNNKKSQLCSGFIYGDNEVRYCTTYKWRYVQHTLRQLDSCVVWYNYMQELETLQHLLGDEAMLVTPKSDMVKVRNYKYLLCHPKSCGEGLDLSFIDANLFLTPPIEFIKYIQSVFRITEQAGVQKKNYILVGRGSIEVYKYSKLMEKNKNYVEQYKSP